MDVKKMVEELAAGVMHNAKGCVPVCQCSDIREAVRAAERVLEQLSEEKGCYMYSLAVATVIHNRLANMLNRGMAQMHHVEIDAYCSAMAMASSKIGAGTTELMLRLDGLNTADKGRKHCV